MRNASIKCSLSLVVMALAGGTAAAQSTNTAALTAPLPDVGGSLLRVGGAMVIVLAVFFGGIWCFRNWQRLVTCRRPSSKLQILEVKALGNRQALYLVACEAQTLLLGSSPSGLTTLCEVKQSTQVECASEPLGNGAFGQKLETILSRQS